LHGAAGEGTSITGNKQEAGEQKGVSKEYSAKAGKEGKGTYRKLERKDKLKEGEKQEKGRRGVGDKRVLEDVMEVEVARETKKSRGVEGVLVTGAVSDISPEAGLTV
jgi:hypothetical protein